MLFPFDNPLIRIFKYILLGLLIIFVGIPLWIAQVTGFWNGANGWLDRRRNGLA